MTSQPVGLRPRAILPNSRYILRQVRNKQPKSELLLVQGDGPRATNRVRVRRAWLRDHRPGGAEAGQGRIAGDLRLQCQATPVPRRTRSRTDPVLVTSWMKEIQARRALAEARRKKPEARRSMSQEESRTLLLRRGSPESARSSRPCRQTEVYSRLGRIWLITNRTC